MIDPAKLTAENGFVDGCVVEIVRDKNRHPQYTEWFIAQWDGWEFEYMESIRPLTGPMAIWNFAPSWATHLDTEDGFFEFVNFKNDGVYEGYINRPFWAVKE